MTGTKTDMADGPARKGRSELTRRMRSPEGLALVVGAISVLALFVGRYLGLFQADGVSFCAVSILFLVPGFLLWSWFLRDGFSSLSSVPMWVILSISVFSITGTPFLIFQTPPGYYVAFCALIVTGFLIAAAVKLLLVRTERPAPEPDDEESRAFSLWLFVPFVLISGSLAYLSWVKFPEIYGDLWIYLSWVNGLADGDRLAFTEPYFGELIGPSRARFNGWLLSQAAFSLASGIEPVELLVRYLNPALVVVSLLSVYTLARTVTRNANAALFIAALYGIFMLYYVGVSILLFGGEFTGRVVEDKYAARYLFLPVALALAARFVQYRRAAYAVFFGLVCWASVTIHPVGIAIIGLSMAGFAAAHILANLRRLGAYTAMGTLAASASTILIIPLVYVASTGNSLAAVLQDADINSGDPDVLANMVFARPDRRRIFEFADGSFIMHPDLILTPVILVALSVGVAFLLTRITSRQDGVGAQLLAGSLLLVTAVCYVPPISTFMGNNVVVPGQLWRLAWPIPLVSVITLGWLGWVLISKLSSVGGLARYGRRIAPVLGACVLALLVGFYSPHIEAGADEVATFREDIGPLEPDPFDPAYRWIRSNIDSPAVFLAPDAENTAIPAYSSEASVVSRRGNLVVDVLPALEARAPGRINVPLGSYQVRYFFRSAYINPLKIRILRQRDVDYLMLYSDWPMIEVLDRSPGFEKLDVPSSRYTIYRVTPEEVRPQN